MRSLLYLSIIGYHRGARQRAQHICKAFVDHDWNVAFVEPGIHNQAYHSDGLYVCSPTVSPKSRLPHMNVSKEEAKDVIDWFVKQEGPVIIYTGCLYWINVIKMLKSIRKDVIVIYDMLDSFWNFSDLAPYKDQLINVHKEILELADHVLYISSAMKDLLHDTPAHHVRNACWFENYDIPLEKEDPPIVGYAGTIADWFDVESAVEIVKAGIRLELLGTCSINLPDELEKCYRGTVQWHGLPDIMKRWSCGLIIHKMNDLTNTADHTKMYEHMAMGLPIVAYPSDSSKYILDNMIEHNPANSDLITLTLDYVSGIKKQLMLDSDDAIIRRKEWALHNTWNERYNQIMNIIDRIK